MQQLDVTLTQQGMGNMIVGTHVLQRRFGHEGIDQKVMKKKMIWVHPVSQKADNDLQLSSMVLFPVRNTHMHFRKNNTNIREAIKGLLKRSRFFPHVFCS
ncbi:hypothetical protein AVEN_141130-1 [Araneus ventricosus]|uniref:Uncharacterized protein n=1 Tax=Araneus ventricosus TaxID=182803 RepID=A0A4Y2KBT2_ARAVE|nr:hypothetical protein AVEN_141130-1 [Araneus ventricosus]